MESLIRVGLTALMVLILSEIAKRSSFIAAIVASSPIATIATCYWLYSENQSIEHIWRFAWQTTMLLPPSLVFFIGMPLALKKGMSFTLAMPLFIVVMLVTYTAYILILSRFGIKFE